MVFATLLLRNLSCYKINKKNLIYKNNLSPSLQNYISAQLSPAEKLSFLFPQLPDSCELLITCHPDNYSASTIARAVEDCNAQLLTLAVTSMRNPMGWPIISLRINHLDPSAVSRSLSRYGFESILESSTEESAAHRRARDNANALIHLLEL